METINEHYLDIEPFLHRNWFCFALQADPRVANKVRPDAPPLTNLIIGKSSARQPNPAAGWPGHITDATMERSQTEAAEEEEGEEEDREGGVVCPGW